MIEKRLDEAESEGAFVKNQISSINNRLGYRILINFYITMEFEDFENFDKALDTHDVGVFTLARLNDRLRGFIGIEFERTATTEGGSSRGDSLEVKQGWIEYTVSDAFNLRFGVVLVPFTKFNLVYFEPMQELTEGPIKMRRVVQ